MATSRSIRKGQRARVGGTADPRPHGASRAGSARVAAAVEQGNVLRERRCLAEAAASYERAVRIDPGCADAYYRLDDTLRFVRYAALVEESGGRVVLACAPELVSLLGRVDGVSEAVPLGGRLPPHSTWAPLPSLPRLFDTTTETVPAGGARLALGARP